MTIQPHNMGTFIFLFDKTYLKYMYTMSFAIYLDGINLVISLIYCTNIIKIIILLGNICIFIVELKYNYEHFIE